LYVVFDNPVLGLNLKFTDEVLLVIANAAPAAARAPIAATAKMAARRLRMRIYISSSVDRC
jgi:hypothetical protein